MAGCSQLGTEPEAGLTGTWAWVSSAGGIAGRSFTPASEHYTVQLKFAAGHVSLLRNDSIKATNSFTVSGDKVTYAPAVSVFLFDPQIEEQTLRVMKGDTIGLADPCCDRYDHIFVRVR